MIRWFKDTGPVKMEFPKQKTLVSRLKVLLLNQCFHPDHVSTAQHLTDLALGLVKAGHEVTVVASSRGYDNPENRYPVSEKWNGIEIRRIWTPGLGKKSKLRRLIDFGIFWLNATRILLFLPRHDVLVCLTSPPLISTLGTLIAKLKGGLVIPWIMDLNPDEAVAAGWLRKGSMTERILTAVQNWSFRQAARIVVLDRFMAARLREKEIPDDVIHVLAPWSHDNVVQYDEAGRAAFRLKHGLEGKFVIMYSGNHSPCHPLDTLLEAAKMLASNANVHFLFVGGGSEFAKVKAFSAAHSAGNITCLPYQPIENLSASLSAPDLHVVVMGDAFLGIVHPCKIYNILNLGLPFLYIGPEPSHVSDLAGQAATSSHTLMHRHDDVAGVVNSIRNAAARARVSPSPELKRVAAGFSQERLAREFVELIQQTCGCLQNLSSNLSGDMRISSAT